MSEYIIYWDGIGSQLTDMLSEHVPPCLWPKRIRQERLREEIVRCRDCKYYNECWDFCERLKPGMVVEPDGFCAWGERGNE